MWSPEREWKTEVLSASISGRFLPIPPRNGEHSFEDRADAMVQTRSIHLREDVLHLGCRIFGTDESVPIDQLNGHLQIASCKKPGKTLAIETRCGGYNRSPPDYRQKLARHISSRRGTRESFQRNLMLFLRCEGPAGDRPALLAPDQRGPDDGLVIFHRGETHLYGPAIMKQRGRQKADQDNVVWQQDQVSRSSIGLEANKASRAPVTEQRRSVTEGDDPFWVHITIR